MNFLKAFSYYILSINISIVVIIIVIITFYGFPMQIVQVGVQQHIYEICVSTN